jgi:molecular chaperone GrpE
LINVPDRNLRPRDASEDRDHSPVEKDDAPLENSDLDAQLDDSPFAAEPQLCPDNNPPAAAVTNEASEESPISADQLQQQLEDANDKLLRSQAELENYRKRSRRELEEQKRYAPLPVMRDLLSVVDNLERAVEATDRADGPNVDSLLEGVKLVTSELKAVLQRHHCQVIEADVGTAFDPNCHEAISQQPSADHPPGTVMHVTQTGYRLHDRVVRPSQVVVATNPASESAVASDKGIQES